MIHLGASPVPAQPIRCSIRCERRATNYPRSPEVKSVSLTVRLNITQN